MNGGLMDCDYVFLYGGAGRVNENTRKFHASTPKEASDTARAILKTEQAKLVQEFEFAPPILKGELYRQMEEFDGSEFIKKVGDEPLQQTLPSLNESKT